MKQKTEEILTEMFSKFLPTAQRSDKNIAQAVRILITATLENHEEIIELRENRLEDYTLLRR